jgi:hypothetical protein
MSDLEAARVMSTLSNRVLSSSKHSFSSNSRLDAVYDENDYTQSDFDGNLNGSEVDSDYLSMLDLLRGVSSSMSLIEVSVEHMSTQYYSIFTFIILMLTTLEKAASKSL